MRVYHRTNHAEAILREDFRDATDTYMTPNEYSGFWVSDSPLDENQAASGRFVLLAHGPGRDLRPLRRLAHGVHGDEGPDSHQVTSSPRQGSVTVSRL